MWLEKYHNEKAEKDRQFEPYYSIPVSQGESGNGVASSSRAIVFPLVARKVSQGEIWNTNSCTARTDDQFWRDERHWGQRVTSQSIKVFANLIRQSAKASSHFRAIFLGSRSFVLRTLFSCIQRTRREKIVENYPNEMVSLVSFSRPFSVYFFSVGIAPKISSLEISYALVMDIFHAVQPAL